TATTPRRRPGSAASSAGCATATASVSHERQGQADAEEGQAVAGEEEKISLSGRADRRRRRLAAAYRGGRGHAARGGGIPARLQRTSQEIPRRPVVPRQRAAARHRVNRAADL